MQIEQTAMRRGHALRRCASWMLVLTLLATMTGAPAAFAQGDWAAIGADTVVDLTFDDAPLAKVFQSLADAADFNVLVDPAVTGNVSFKLRNVTVREAVDLVTQVTGYHYEIFGRTLIIASEARTSRQPAATELEIIPVQHVAPDEAASMLTRLYPDVDVISDEGNKLLILQGAASDVDAVRTFLSQYDRDAKRPLQFRNEPVESILWQLADRAGWNLIVDGDLTGVLSARLDGIDYAEALALVSEAAHLEYRLTDNVAYVTQAAPPPEPVMTRRVAIERLDHVDPGKTAEVLANLYPDIQVNVDEASRTLVLEGEDEALAAVEAFVQKLDVARRQVIVEARLEEIDVNALQRLGVDWDDERGAFSPTQLNPLVLAWEPGQLRARLDALNEQGLSTVLASPKLAAIDGESATILIGDRIPLLLKSEDDEGRVTETLEFIEAGIKLEVLATISSDDAVTLDIDTEVSSIASMTAQDVPQIRTREMNTRVRVRDGQSLVIGGLIQETERERMSGMPLLGDLPLLGRLFSSRVKENVQTEMVIFLIPHIVHDTPETPEAARDGEHPALHTVGSVVPGAVGAAASPGVWGPGAGDGRGEPTLGLASDEHSVAWFDVTSHMMGAWDFQLEKRHDANGFLTGLYVAPRDGIAYGGNIAVRRYGSAIAGITPWAGLGLEYLAPPAGDAGYNLSARLGIGTREAAPLRIELYGEYSLSDGHIGLPSDDVPARWDGLRAGVRLGWEY